jgi:hypothetical protein
MDIVNFYSAAIRLLCKCNLRGELVQLPSFELVAATSLFTEVQGQGRAGGHQMPSYRGRGSKRRLQRHRALPCTLNPCAVSILPGRMRMLLTVDLTRHLAVHAQHNILVNLIAQRSRSHRPPLYEKNRLRSEEII